MKFNQWTIGLAAVGAVSLASAARAEEAKLSQLNTAVSNTTISGYVDVAAQYALGNAAVGDGRAYGVNSGKNDAFTVNSVTISLDKPQDESPWASGYHFDLNTGTDAIAPIGGYLRQAYVALRTPVGNGIDWKVGLFDNIIGYEGNTDGANPNYTRSYGYSIEPTSLAGALATYKVNSSVQVQAGIADSLATQLVSQENTALTVNNISAKTYVASVSLTAPDSWGWLKGAALNLGVNYQNAGNFKGNVNTAQTQNSQVNYYAGLSLPTPITALTLGVAFDYITLANEGHSQDGLVNTSDDTEWVAGLYASYKATDKLTLNLRGEFYDEQDMAAQNQAEEVTATVQYNLWANVISRAEFRWDHIGHGTGFGPAGQYENSYLAAVNLIYQF